MLKNEIITALRNITRHKIQAAVNITGLSMGMCVSVLILFWVWGEIRYDGHHIHARRIYRAVSTVSAPGLEPQGYAGTPAPYGPSLKEAFDGIEGFVRLYPSRMLVRRGDRKAFEELLFADATLFDVFTFQPLQGDPQSALLDPGSVVMTRSAAREYFGNDSPLNQTLRMENERCGSRRYTVTAVIADPPEHSHFRTGLFASMATLESIPFYEENHFRSWTNRGMYTYLLIHEGIAAGALEESLSGFDRRNTARTHGTGPAPELTTHLQPLRSIHLNSHLQEELRPNGDRSTVAALSLVAFSILLLACVNYTNLATAQTIARSREVGIRKAVGASPKQLVKQFFIEAFIFTLIALVFTVLLIELAMPLYHSITGETLGHTLFTNWAILGILVILLLFVGFLSGSYPAYALSHSSPASILRGLLSFGMDRINIRRGLVVFQFFVSIGLIIVTLVIHEQLEYMSTSRGYDARNILVIPIHSGWMQQDPASAKEALEQNPNILSVAVTPGAQGGRHAAGIQILPEGRTAPIPGKMIGSDHDFVRTLGLRLVSGRDFSRDAAPDAPEALLLNESAVRELNLPHPLDARIRWRADGHGPETRGVVIGVVGDFQYPSIESRRDPLVIRVDPGPAGRFLIRIRPGHAEDTVATLRQAWERLDPVHPLEYDFLEQALLRRYRTEIHLSRVLAVLSILSIVTASLGLLGLTAFLVQQRTKEIGMRKVLGASFMDILSVLVHEFSRWILLANVLAWPLAFLVARKWLMSFQSRILIGLDTFLLSGFAVCVIALTSICFLALRIALTSPTENLRYE